MESKNTFIDPLDGHPQTVFEKLRRKILLPAGIFPGILGKSNEGNMQHLTRAKAKTISDAELSTGKKLNWQKETEGD